MKIKTKGAVSIPLVMGIGILLFLIVISLTSVETARIYLVQASVDGTQAFEYAKSGVRDALENMARNNTFGITTVKYQIDMAEKGCERENNCVKVAVLPPLSTSTKGRIIGAMGYYKSAIRGLEAEVEYDENNFGQIKLIKTKETLSPLGI